MNHPAPVNSEVKVFVTADLQLNAAVKWYVTDINQLYHYHLETQFTDGNNVETVQLHDILETIVVLPEEK